MIIANVAFQATISLGVIILGVLVTCAAGFAVWRTQSVAALRQAADDVRRDRDDWEARYKASKTDYDDLLLDSQRDRDRMEQKIMDVTAQCQELTIEVARLQGMTDTSKLAKGEILDAFRAEVQDAIKRQVVVDKQKLDLISKQSDTINVLIERLGITQEGSHESP